MGLTSHSTGNSVETGEFKVFKKTKADRVLAIAGNPNVGKSTLFNSITGMNQHTGNWAGKTVANAQGYCKSDKNSYVLVDIPGTYSLLSHSREEEIARDFICFGNIDGVVAVCDATNLERNLNLVLQIKEITSNLLVCVNLLDEAKRKGIHIDLEKLSKILGVPVVGTVAKNKSSLKALVSALDNISANNSKFQVKYDKSIEEAVSILEMSFEGKKINLNTRWLSTTLLSENRSLFPKICADLGFNPLEDSEISSALQIARMHLKKSGITPKMFEERLAAATVKTAEKIAKQVVSYKPRSRKNIDRKLDKILTSPLFGYPIMLFSLAVIFWLTIWGANYISQILSLISDLLLSKTLLLLNLLGLPETAVSFIIDGILRVPLWVVSVMLPPMAIFFPLFTLLEDSGFLPRIAFNLDKPFKACKSCGKQSLTMCMGFGCNAAGVIGCRIIDSPRERLLGIITNSLVPCNGRFPAIISIISMFFIAASGFLGGMGCAVYLTAFILLGVLFTFIVTKLLSLTFLKGVPSSYILELPPYRKPHFLQVLVHSLFDRTLFVLARAVTVAVPTGIIIWLLGNISFSEVTLLSSLSEFFDPIGELMGLDGVILLAFILGFPANEIVVPIILMSYLGSGSLVELSSLTAIKEILLDNGWNTLTALNTVIFFLFHWPCSTTLITIKKETDSIKWPLLSALLPTAIGFLICVITTFIYRLIL